MNPTFISYENDTMRQIVFLNPNNITKATWSRDLSELRLVTTVDDPGEQNIIRLRGDDAVTALRKLQEMK